MILDINIINTLHADCITRWKTAGISSHHTDILKLVEENHAFNYQLWHAEDRARREDKGFEYIYHAKREIDHCNQQRNNCMEAIDEWIYHALKPASHVICPVHSETPGMMIDRLSIMSLKFYHMALQVKREDVDTIHQNACSKKLAVIAQQQKQLSTCLQELLAEVQKKTRTFRVYHQFKMYNDPTLNPELYQKDN